MSCQLHSRTQLEHERQISTHLSKSLIDVNVLLSSLSILCSRCYFGLWSSASHPHCSFPTVSLLSPKSPGSFFVVESEMSLKGPYAKAEGQQSMMLFRDGPACRRWSLMGGLRLLGVCPCLRLLPFTCST